jgi:hypothetical protein
MLTESIEERLKWFKSNHYKCSDNILIVEEKNKDGEAEITCLLQNEVICFTIEKGKLGCLVNEKCADAIIFEKVATDHWHLHIMECKRTVKKDTWESDIKKQFEAAIFNAYAIMGILGIQVEHLTCIKCYTAFRRDLLTLQQNPDPVSLKAMVGEKARPPASMDWENNGINLLSIENIMHEKIKLDNETGKGKVTLSV